MSEEVIETVEVDKDLVAFENELANFENAADAVERTMIIQNLRNNFSAIHTARGDAINKAELAELKAEESEKQYINALKEMGRLSSRLSLVPEGTAVHTAAKVEEVEDEEDITFEDTRAAFY